METVLVVGGAMALVLSIGGMIFERATLRKTPKHCTDDELKQIITPVGRMLRERALRESPAQQTPHTSRRAA